jgi:hypothetical protein
MAYGNAARLCSTCFELLTHTVGDESWKAKTSQCIAKLRDELCWNEPRTTRTNVVRPANWFCKGVLGVGAAVTATQQDGLPVQLNHVEWIRYDEVADARYSPTHNIDQVKRLIKLCPNLTAVCFAGCKLDKSTLDDVAKLQKCTRFDFTVDSQSVVDLFALGKILWADGGDSGEGPQRVQNKSSLEVAANGMRFTRRDCCVVWLKHDPQNSKIWASLADELSGWERVTVNGIQYTARDCCVEALTHDAKQSKAWSILAGTLPSSTDNVIVNGVRLNRKECCLEALKCNMNNIQAWTYLADEMAPDEQLMINGNHFNQRLCCVAWVQRDPDNAQAWERLAESMSSTPHVPSCNINGTWYPVKECYLECLKRDPNNRKAWEWFARSLEPGERMTLNGNPFTAEECQSLASALNPAS